MSIFEMLKSGILPSFGGSSTYICYMHTMFEQAPISGLAITCMKTVLEHGSFYVISFMLFLQRKAFYLLP
ncbi:hypothetical protein ACTQ1R_03085 [Prevotellaceae bacterium LCP21S3_C11]